MYLQCVAALVRLADVLRDASLHCRVQLRCPDGQPEPGAVQLEREAKGQGQGPRALSHGAACAPGHSAAAQGLGGEAEAQVELLGERLGEELRFGVAPDGLERLVTSISDPVGTEERSFFKLGYICFSVAHPPPPPPAMV